MSDPISSLLRCESIYPLENRLLLPPWLVLFIFLLSWLCWYFFVVIVRFVLLTQQKSLFCSLPCFHAYVVVFVLFIFCTKLVSTNGG